MNPNLTIIFVSISLLFAVFGVIMWITIISTVCKAKEYDIELYKKWGSPVPSGYLWNPKDQISIISASLEITFTSARKLGSHADPQTA
jgi:hypothetical protein